MFRIAYSPCPNDTFIFHAWSHGLLPGAPELQVTHADIDQTNQWAASASSPYDILKISFAALPYALDSYALLPCGGALGQGCGPLLLTGPNLKDRQNNLAGHFKIAIPSNRSTAFLLLRLWLEEQEWATDVEFVVIPFHQIMDSIANGQFDAGLVIHEARFTYPQYGLQQMVDLGDWWEHNTGNLIPLGAIVAKRTLDHQQIAAYIRQSLHYARQQPQQSRDYIRCHAQELSDEVVRAHIDLYVNEYSFNVGSRGRQSIHDLLMRAMNAKLIPTFSLENLWCDADFA